MTSKGPRLTFLGWLFILAFIAACGYGAWHLLKSRPIRATPKAADSGPAQHATDPPAEAASARPGKKVAVGIAYGTEKKRWLEWAVEEFKKSPEGKGIEIELIPMGSQEGAHAILAEDKRIHVWSPASNLYKDVFLRDWNFKHSSNPIARGEALALSPMVFVMWAERYEQFIARYSKLDFYTVSKALQEPGGWDAIAGKPEWGLFKFSHTNPTQSNSGLMTLVLMAYDFFNRTRGLSLKDILNPAFQSWMNAIENGVTGMSNSTGNQMREMVLRGPSTYDALFVYENVVIDYLKNAEGRWGQLRVAYPKTNMWNDNPYYILDVPWTTAAQKKAAGEFLDFLLSERIQREALKHGFRPGNPAVPILFPESPFTQYAGSGLQVEIGQVCEPPKAEVIQNLLEAWQRGRTR